MSSSSSNTRLEQWITDMKASLPCQHCKLNQWFDRLREICAGTNEQPAASSSDGVVASTAQVAIEVAAEEAPRRAAEELLDSITD